MNAKVIRLDRFSSTDGPLQRLTEADLAEAHDRGLSEGMRLAGETTLAMLVAQLEHLQSTLTLGEEQLREMRRQTLHSLAPVLQSLVCTLAPSSHIERTITALRTELDRLIDDATPMSCTIICGPELEAAVKTCLPPANSQIRVVIAASHAGKAEITYDGGLIRFDDAVMVDEIAKLIQDILQEN